MKIKSLADAKKAILEEFDTKEHHIIVIGREITERAYQWGLEYSLLQIEQAETEILRQIDEEISKLNKDDWGVYYMQKARKIITGEGKSE